MIGSVKISTYTDLLSIQQIICRIVIIFTSLAIGLCGYFTIIISDGSENISSFRFNVLNFDNCEMLKFGKNQLIELNA